MALKQSKAKQERPEKRKKKKKCKRPGSERKSQLSRELSCYYNHRGGVDTIMDMESACGSGSIISR